jgi:hypothetical protein
MCDIGTANEMKNKSRSISENCAAEAGHERGGEVSEQR